MLSLFFLGNFLGYYAAWFLLLYTAESRHHWIGPLFAVFFLTAHFLFTPTRKSDIKTLLAVSAIGWVMDSTHVLTGSFSFQTYSPIIIPIWLLFVWMIFSVLLNHSLGWLKGRYILASILGAIFAPLSYYSGIAFNVVTFSNPIQTLTTISVMWAILMPTFVLINSRLQDTEA